MSDMTPTEDQEQTALRVIKRWNKLLFSFIGAEWIIWLMGIVYLMYLLDYPPRLNRIIMCILSISVVMLGVLLMYFRRYRSFLQGVSVEEKEAIREGHS